MNGGDWGLIIISKYVQAQVQRHTEHSIVLSCTISIMLCAPSL